MSREKDFLSWNETKNFEYFNEFNKLCLRAKAYLWDWILSDYGCEGIGDAIINLNVCNPDLTPIEQIWNVCYARFFSQYVPFTEECEKIDKLCSLELPIEIYFYEGLTPQKEIKYKDKIYVADFVLDFSLINNKFTLPKLKNLKYVIELDGFDYHNKKQQMNYDYEREQNLQLLGYKIMRFTGSQIYNKPYDCIYKFFSMVFNDIEKECKNGKKTN